LIGTVKKVMARVWSAGLTASTVALMASGSARADDSDLDASIAAGFGKLVKYGRWSAALVLGIVFCLAWAERGQNPDNPHEVNKGTKKMIWSGAGFIAVIGYKLVLTGIVKWFNVDPAAIPSFLWQ
jgi:hypothetical protein